MDQLDYILDFQSSPLSVLDFLFGLILVIFFSFIIKWAYARFALSVSNRFITASMFPFFAVAIFVIVSTIKSSLVLSLGLVGALSIIRFRTAIKEPEQLIYYLILTAISISVAAEIYVIALLTFLFTIAYTFYRRFISSTSTLIENDQLMIRAKKISLAQLEELTGVVINEKCNITVQNYHEQAHETVVVLKADRLNLQTTQKLRNFIDQQKDIELIDFQLLNSID